MLELPGILKKVLKNRARAALESPSIERLASFHDREAVESAIETAIRELDEECGVNCVSLREILGRDAKVRHARIQVPGGMEFVYAVIDLIMAAKGCGYRTAQSIVRRLALDYYGVVLDDRPDVDSHLIHFRTIIFQGQGSRPTLCVGVRMAVELIMLVPGSAIATEVRRRVADAFIRVSGGDVALFDEIARNHRIQEYLARHDPENPIRAAGEYAGRKRSFDEASEAIQSLAKQLVDQQLAILRITDTSIKQLAEQQQAIKQLAEQQAQCEASVASMHEAVLSPSGALVAALRAAVRPRPRRQRQTSELFPPAQQATSEECAALATTLVAVAKALSPALTFAAWRAIRSSFGRACKAERLRRHGLGREHPDFVARPLLWTSIGPSVPGGGVRYLYLRTEEPLVASVWLGFSARATALPAGHEPWPAHPDDAEPPGGCEDDAQARPGSPPSLQKKWTTLSTTTP